MSISRKYLALFVCYVVLSFGVGLLLDNYQLALAVDLTPPDDISCQEINQEDKPQCIDNKNWERNSQFLLEPIAKIISNGNLKIKIIEANKKSNYDFSNPKILDSGISYYTFSKTTISNRGIFKNDGKMLLSYVPSSDNFGSFSIIVTSPDLLKDWTYTAMYNFDNKKIFSSPYKIYTSINKCRDVNEDNIHDEIFSGPISFYDLAVDVEGGDINEEEVSRKELLIPISINQLDTDRIAMVESSQSSQAIGNSFNQVKCDLNLATKVEKKYTPSKKVSYSTLGARIDAVKKEVSIVQKRFNKTFADIGFELIVRDIETKLPYYKLIYNSKIIFQRAVFYYWQEAKVGNDLVQVLDGVFAVDKEGHTFYEAGLVDTYQSLNSKCLDDRLKILCQISTNQ